MDNFAGKSRKSLSLFKDEKDTKKSLTLKTIKVLKIEKLLSFIFRPDKEVGGKVALIFEYSHHRLEYNNFKPLK